MRYMVYFLKLFHSLHLIRHCNARLHVTSGDMYKTTVSSTDGTVNFDELHMPIVKTAKSVD